jgi:hypothetical protein
MFSMWYVPRCYKQKIRLELSHPRVEAGSNTSTVALRVVGDDEKEPSAWGYNRANHFLGDTNTETWPSRLGESRI